MHTHFWSLSLRGIRRVSGALRGRWRRSILQQRSTKKITWTYDGNVAIGFDTNANEQCIPTLGHGIFVLYWVLQLRCQDGNAVLYYNSARPTWITWTYEKNLDINFDTNSSKQRTPTLGHAVVVGYDVFWVRWVHDDAVLYCNSAQPKRSRGHMMEMRKSVLLQTPINSAYPLLVIAYLCYTTCFNSAAGTATLCCIATALNRKKSRGHTIIIIIIKTLDYSRT